MFSRQIAVIAAFGLALGAWSTPAAGHAAASTAAPHVSLHRVGRASRLGAQDDACALLTQQEVGAALGVAVEKGQPLVPNDRKLCGWAPPGGPKIDGKKATLLLTTPREHDFGKTPVSGIEKTPVSGVGDDAYYVTTPGFGTAINVKKGARAFQLRVGGFPKAKEEAIEKSLAVLVLKRL
jgi:hypothetical protein